jgi:hypothetical protein
MKIKQQVEKLEGRIHRQHGLMNLYTQAACKSHKPKFYPSERKIGKEGASTPKYRICILLAAVPLGW